MGHQTPGREFCRRRSGPGLRAEGAHAHLRPRRAFVPEAMHDFASIRTLDLWYARTDVDRLIQSFRTKVSSAGYQTDQARPDEGSNEDQSQGVREADPRC